MRTTSIALEQLLRAIGDPVALLGAIGPGDPEFERAQLIRAGAGVLAKSPDALPAIAQALEAADGLKLSPQTRAHFSAAEAWLSGNPIRAAESYVSILNKWPRDLLALRLAQSCYFFLGWHEQLCTVVDGAVAGWTGTQRGYQFVLALASFAHAENGDATRAEALGREALLHESACPLGVHAVAHAIAASGDHRSGAEWMRDQRAQWATESRMRTHNAWHLAMFDAEAGNVASALDILDTWLLPESARSPLDACDAAALLWCLTAAGVDDEGRWSAISEAFERRLTPGFWPYVDLHAGLAHWMAARPTRALRLMREIDHCAEGVTHAAWRARHVTVPGLQALHAWAEGRYGDAAVLLAQLQPTLGVAGASRVQLAVFDSIRREAGERRRDQSQRLPPPGQQITAASSERLIPLEN
jgi:hypothetical protein